MFRSSWDVGDVLTPDNSTGQNGPDFYGCDLCTDGGWTSETEVELHKTKEHYTKAFLKSLWKKGDYCCICVTKYESKEAVLKHIKTEHLLSSEDCLRVEREIFVCDVCSAMFFNEQNLILHLRYIHMSPLKNQMVMCILCARNVRKRNMLEHFYMHQIQSVATCRICLEKFRNSHVLDKHMRRHPFYLKCNMCQVETGKSESFRNHILEVHKKLKKYDNLTTGNTRQGNSVTTKTRSGNNRMTVGATSETYNVINEVYCDEDSDSGLVTVIQICEDDPLKTDVDTKMTDETTNSKDLITVNDLMSGDRKEELIDSDLMTEVKEVKALITENVIEKTVKNDFRRIYRNNDFRRFFIPKKKPAFVKLQKVAGVRGLILTNDVHICVLCREICVGSEQMRLHTDEHSVKAKMEKKYLYECSCGEGFHNKVLLKHHKFKTKHVVDAK